MEKLVIVILTLALFSISLGCGTKETVAANNNIDSSQVNTEESETTTSIPSSDPKILVLYSSISACFT